MFIQRSLNLLVYSIAPFQGNEGEEGMKGARGFKGDIGERGIKVKTFSFIIYFQHLIVYFNQFGKKMFEINVIF